MRRVFRIPFSRGHIAREVDDELAFHIEMRTQRLVAAGWSVDAARAEALRQFGDVAMVRDDCVTMDQQRERAMHRANVFGELQQDVVYALRTLRRNAGFTAVIVAALALGIGANTAIFTLIDAVIVRSLPVSDPEQLVAIGDPARVSSMSQGSPRTDLMSTPLFNDIRRQSRSFSGVLASGRTGRLDARVADSAGELEHPRGRFISANYFRLLGVGAARGRVFDGSEDTNVGGSPVATISYGYWTRRFHNDPSVIGRAITIQDTKITIIGVAREDFAGEIVGGRTDIWLPMTMHDALFPNQRILDDRNTAWLLLLGRLSPGVTLEQARAELMPLITRSVVDNSNAATASAFTAGTKTWYIGSGAKGFSRVRATFQAPLFTLMIGVGLLLCIICANVANLLLARAVARGREMAVRLALGAARNRLVRQLLTESLVLAGLGAGVGLLVAWWGSHALLVLAGDGSAIPVALNLDVRVLVFTLLVSCLAVTLFGLVPALRASRVELASTMRSSAQSLAGSALGQRGQRAPLGKLLIAGQVALSIVLLVGAAMLVRSLRNVQSVELGLDRDHLLIVDLDINAHGYTGERLGSLVHTLHDRVAALPGVSAVSYSVNGIFSGTESLTNIQVPGFVARVPDDSSIAYDQIGPNYARAIGGRMLQGRDFTVTDQSRYPANLAILNESAAKLYFPKGNAVGQFVRFTDTTVMQIVGVMADTRDHELAGDPGRRIYFTYLNTDTTFTVAGSLRLEVLTRGEPSALVQPVRKAIVAVDPSLPIDGVAPLTQLMKQSIAEERLVARLATGFGVMALVLAGIGLYGVMTYAITRRTGEIGLRAALGATRADVIRMVLFDALRLVGAGIVVGLLLALPLTRLLRAQLHGVGAVDPASMGAAIAVLAISAVIAVLVPALRASRVSPIVALRAEG
jgi:predicted permease